MSTLRQINIQKVISLMTMIMILLGTVVKSSEFSDNLHLTQPSQSLYLSEPTQTTVLVNGSTEKPRVLRMHRPCKDEDSKYCEHGQCMYPQDSDKPSCKCVPPYVGDRCMLIKFVEPSQTISTHEELISILLGVAFLICLLIIAIYCCLKERCKTPSPPYKPYGSENSV